VEIIHKYFSDFSEQQITQLAQLEALYKEWNAQINVISRKDMDHFYEHHVLHSLSIATEFEFFKDQNILDLGSGGGFPGIPLAIMFPETKFLLLDSIHKKLKVSEAVIDALKLKNVETRWMRAEDLDETFDYVVCRAVGHLAKLWSWSKPLLKNNGGLICLKGGDLNQEIGESKLRPKVWELSTCFEEAWYAEKYLLYCSKA